jgi:hypothetical protein
VTPAQHRLMACGLELSKLLQLRTARRALMPDMLARLTPAAHAGYLMGLADLDQRIRDMRLLLADSLHAAA